MERLPFDIFLLIQPCLSSADFFCLLNSSKCLFAQLKRENAFWNLTGQASLLYLRDKSFRRRLSGLLKDPYRQVAISIIDPDFDIMTAAGSFTVHKVRWYCNQHAPSIPYLPHISSLDVYSPVSDVSHCSHLKSLGCDIASSLSDFSPLVNIPELRVSINGTYGDNDAGLLNIAKVMLNRQQATSYNVTYLHSLTLHTFSNLEDVSPFKGIYDLGISDCPKVRDISGLGNHHKLSINKCAAVLSGYDILRTIPFVALEGCDISDLSVLQNAKEVVLCCCNNIEDVSYLRKVRKVTLNSCSRITDISSLDGVRDLTIDNLHSLTTSIMKMKDNCTLNVVIRRVVGTGSFFHAIHKLKIWALGEEYSPPLPLLTRIEANFPYLRDLTIWFIETDFSLQNCGQIETIEIFYCSQLTSLQGLGNNRSVTIKYCPLITDVSCLRTVPIVRIHRCQGIRDFSCLEGVVPRLRIIND